MSHRHGKAKMVVTKEIAVARQTQTDPEWKEHDGFRFPFRSTHIDGEEEREVFELEIRGKVVKAFLRGGNTATH